jgi:hypothetical protein
MSAMSRARRLVPVLSVVATCVVVSACTQDGPAIPDTPGRATSSTTTAPTKPDYPLSIQRLGMSGDDRGQRVSIQEDRTVLATGSTDGQQVTCSLSSEAFSSLSAAALQIARTSTGAQAPATDTLLFEGIGPTDDRVAPVRNLVTELLADVAKPPAKRTLCR